MTTRHRPMSRRAFSLVELLIVILIIALVIAIVLPALGHARTAAKNAATKNLMVQVSQACSSFIISERRMPGYFSAADMGSASNATEGFTGMENVMFDLAGGVVPAGSAGAYPCGPISSKAVLYNRDLVGVAQAGNKAYFTPPAKYFKMQDGVESPGTKVANANHQGYVRDLVDAFGTPILMWSSDPMSIQPIATQSDFAVVASGVANPPASARFYWNSNAAFLGSSACGEKRADENAQSILGGNNPNRAVSMIGVLGNPGSPNSVTNSGPNLLPTSARGQFILQSGGADGTYVGREDRGGKIAGPSATLGYDLNFRSQPSSDIMADFDDLLVAGG